MQNRKKIKVLNDLQANVGQISKSKKASNPYNLTIPVRKMHSFVVSWQMPVAEGHTSVSGIEY